MQELKPNGKPYILSLAQRQARAAYRDKYRDQINADARARRHAIRPPRVPMTPEEYRLKRLAAAKAKREQWKLEFVGPRWPAGWRRGHEPRPETPKVPRPSRIDHAAQASLRLQRQQAREDAAALRASQALERQRIKADRAAEKVALSAGRAWDTQAVRLVAQTVRALRKAASTATLRLSREAMAAIYAKAKALTDSNTDAQGAMRRSTFHRIADAEQTRQDGQALPAVPVASNLIERRAAAEAAALVLAAGASRPIGRVLFRPHQP